MKVERKMPDRFGGQKFEEADVQGNYQPPHDEYLRWVQDTIGLKHGVLHNICDTIVWVASGTVFCYTVGGMVHIGLHAVAILVCLLTLCIFGYGLLAVAPELKHGQFFVFVRLISFVVGLGLMVL